MITAFIRNFLVPDVQPRAMRSAPFTTSIPFHHQIAQVLRGRIESGSWGEGITEHALCAEFGVSRTTVRQALGSLKLEGLLHSRRGVGTRGVPSARPARAVRASGDPLHGAIATRPRVVSSGTVAALPEVASFLGIGVGEAVLQVVRVHDLLGAPLSVVVSYLPAEFGAGLTRAELRGATHDLLWRRFGLKQKKSTHTLRVARADAMVASLLGIGLAEPVLRVQSSVYLDDGRPIRWTENFFHEDRYEYRAEMEWPDPSRSARTGIRPTAFQAPAQIGHGAKADSAGGSRRGHGGATGEATAESPAATARKRTASVAPLKKNSLMTVRSTKT